MRQRFLTNRTAAYIFSAAAVIGIFLAPHLSLADQTIYTNTLSIGTVSPVAVDIGSGAIPAGQTSMSIMHTDDGSFWYPYHVYGLTSGSAGSGCGGSIVTNVGITVLSTSTTVVGGNSVDTTYFAGDSANPNFNACVSIYFTSTNATSGTLLYGSNAYQTGYYATHVGGTTAFSPYVEFGGGSAPSSSPGITYFDFNLSGSSSSYSHTWTGGPGSFTNLLYRLGKPLASGTIGSTVSKGYFYVTANLAAGQACGSNYLILEGFSDSNYSSYVSSTYFQADDPFQSAGLGEATETYSTFGGGGNVTINPSDYYVLYLLCESNGNPSIQGISSSGNGFGHGATGYDDELDDNVVNGIPGFCLADDAAACSAFLSNMQQYGSDGVTPISPDGTTTQSTIVFGATVNSAGTSTLQLQIEVEPSSTSFTGTPNATSTWVASGTQATATFATSTAINSSVYPLDPESWSDGQFHWQARTIAFSTGVTSTWQTFGSNATGTDFRIQTVPLYTQEATNYPDSTDSATWASSTYDNAYPGSQCGTGSASSTIAACGCAITSVSMWLRYYGITTNNSGTDVNPETLNDWLVNKGGYDNSNGGTLIWSEVDGYASPPGGGTIIWDSNSPNYGTSTSVLAPYIDSLLSSSTPDPVILFEKNAPDGSATTTHFVVAIATSTYNGTSTYAIRDSYWYNTQFLNQPTSTGPGTVNFYNNTINGIEVYYDPPQIPAWGQYDINVPNSLMLVDSQGRRTGEDPATGISYHEIPNTAYGVVESTPGHPVGELTFSNLLAGEYTLYVLGGQTGIYTLNIANNHGQQPFEGTIQKGAMVAFVQSYDPSNLASSTFSASSTSSSTASITTAPPNNLPPPPLPTPILKPVVKSGSILLQPPTSTPPIVSSIATPFQDIYPASSSILINISTVTSSIQ